MKKWVQNILLLGFILGCYRGHVALWEEGNPKPLIQYPYPISLLPPADQAALREGIPIADQLELARLLEDYLS